MGIKNSLAYSDGTGSEVLANILGFMILSLMAIFGFAFLWCLIEVLKQHIFCFQLIF